MVDDVALRNRRSKRHRRGDHSLCRPERCERAPGAVLHLEPMTGPAWIAPGRLTAATVADLRAAGREGSTDGVAAVALAELFDKGGHTGPGAASLVKAHREALNRALEGVDEGGDVVEGIFGRA